MNPRFTIDQDFVRLGACQPVRAQLIDPHGATPSHDHEFHEIAFVICGSIRHRTAEGETTLHAGDVLILSPRSVHAYDRGHDCAVINLYYLADWFLGRSSALHAVPGLVPVFFGTVLYQDSGLPRHVRLAPDGGAFRRIRRELDDLLAADAADRSGLYLEAAFFKILDELTRALNEAAPEAMQAGLPDAVTQRGLRHLELLAARRQPFSATVA
ncbi:MAG: AraC family ligand binding domain-containing protein, partial [Burkholderiales bacterium]|nr:AraC family ligand binding domain-containing protein [Opitutaceae bacterium]